MQLGGKHGVASIQCVVCGCDTALGDDVWLGAMGKEPVYCGTLLVECCKVEGGDTILCHGIHVGALLYHVAQRRNVAVVPEEGRARE